MATNGKNIQFDSVQEGVARPQNPVQISNVRDGYKPHKPEGVKRPQQMPIPPRPTSTGSSGKNK